MSAPILVSYEILEQRTRAALLEAGAGEESAAAAVKAMMHASSIGVDSHGVRLAAHYARAIKGGRINGKPNIAIRQTAASSAVVDADNALGHHAGYVAISKAVELARDNGVGAVGVIHSSHFGAAGAYAREAAEAGMIGFATANSDSIVVPFQGKENFHGTNPIAFGAPSGEERPWLLDMATSSVPMNRMLLYKSLGVSLPPGVAVDKDGSPTTDPAKGDKLLPMGGVDFAFKGAALAGLATVFSAVLQGTTLDHQMIPMVGGDDYSTPRNMGQFYMAINPKNFGGEEIFVAGMRTYLQALRSVPAQDGAEILAPGDREWRVEKERARDGIPIDPDTAAFLNITA